MQDLKVLMWVSKYNYKLIMLGYYMDSLAMNFAHIDQAESCGAADFALPNPDFTALYSFVFIPAKCYPINWTWQKAFQYEYSRIGGKGASCNSAAPQDSAW